MQKNKISRYLIVASTFTLLAIFAMVVQKSYSNLMGPIDKAKESNLTQPINPEIDLETLKLVEEKLEPSQ